jgi:ATP-dependent DNA helicase RecG
MAAFIANEVQVLVATTVIEVGGRAQRQPDGDRACRALRPGPAAPAARAGWPGVHESVCILLFAQPLSQTGRERLKAIYEHTDGFVIAREDLRIRGPGEFIGARQSGVPLLRYADLEADAPLVEVARELAESLLRDAPQVADVVVTRWFGGRASLLKA